MSLLLTLGLLLSSPAEALMPHFKCIGCDLMLRATVDRSGQLDLTLDGESLREAGDLLQIATRDDGDFTLTIADAIDASGETWEISVAEVGGGAWRDGRSGASTTVDGGEARTISVQVTATSSSGGKIKYGPVIKVKPKG